MATSCLIGAATGAVSDVGLWTTRVSLDIAHPENIVIELTVASVMLTGDGTEVSEPLLVSTL